jgi:hypothetical protein
MEYYIILAFEYALDHVIWIRTDVTACKIKQLIIGTVF